jgi:transcriptional regulator with XRE-family HTH domain
MRSCLTAYHPINLKRKDHTMTKLPVRKTPLAQLVSDWLDETGNTATSLARMAGISHQTALNILKAGNEGTQATNQIPNAKTLRALARAMGIPEDTVKSAAMHSGQYALHSGLSVDTNVLMSRLSQLDQERQEIVYRRLLAMEWEQEQELKSRKKHPVIHEIGHSAPQGLPSQAGTFD